MTGIAVAIGLLIIAAGCRPRLTRDVVIERAVSFLWSQQRNDGAWPSATHGIVGGGTAWTPFILQTLADVPESSIGSFRGDAAGFASGLDFIRRSVDRDGAVGRFNPVEPDFPALEYPNYATSYALRALQELGTEADSTLIARMTSYLLSQQWDEARGVGPEHPAYGAWGFGEVALSVGDVGHVDLSHTRRVLEALPADATEARAKAVRFLGLLQKSNSDEREILGSPQNSVAADGGFYASPIVDGTNKGGIEIDQNGRAFFRSYATATCDGILALIAAGVDPTDERITAALKWLSDHPELERVPGIPPAEDGNWEDVMFYYHLAVRSTVLAALQPNSPDLQRIETMIMTNQARDGSFSNPRGAPNKEDDPLLATTLALIALTNIYRLDTSA
jgi:hypothetical protein